MFQPEALLIKYPRGVTGMPVGNLAKHPDVKAVAIDGSIPTYDNVKNSEYPSLLY